MEARGTLELDLQATRSEYWEHFETNVFGSEPRGNSKARFLVSSDSTWQFIIQRGLV